VCVTAEDLDQGTVYVDGQPVPTTRRSAGRTAALCFTTPPHAPGGAEVTVRTPTGGTSNPVPFRYEETRPPQIDRLDPARGPDVGGTNVCVTGENLDQGTVYVDGTPVPTRERTDLRSRSVSLCFTTPPHAPGNAEITVRTPNGKTSNPVRFRYEETPPPHIDRLDRARGPDVGGTVVCLTGENLDQGTVYVDGDPVRTTERANVRSGNVTLCFVTPPHAPGDAEITVRTPNGKTSNAVRFRYEETPPPRLRRIDPTRGPDVGGTEVCLTGDNLDQGTVYVDGSPVPTRERSDPRTRSVSLCFTTPPHAPGDAEITVRTPNGKTSNPLRFRYDATPPPRVERVVPSTGPESGGTAVCLLGENLDQGTVFLDGTPVATRQGPSGGRGRALCFITPPHPAGDVLLTVRTPNGHESNGVHFRYVRDRTPRI
jgi:hypothetical protein